MRIDAELAALRGDDASQRNAERAMANAKRRWLSTPAVARLRQEFAVFDGGSDLAECEELAATMGQLARACALYSGLLDETLPALRRYPWAHLPFRHQRSGPVSVIQLLAGERAELSVVLRDAAAKGGSKQAACTTAGFIDVMRHEIVLRGQASGRMVERGTVGGAMRESPCELAPGAILAIEGRDHSRIIDQISQPLVSLRLVRKYANPLPTCEYRLADGAKVHQASGDASESGREMAMAVLRAMGRSDAAPYFVQHIRSGHDHARWQALRECLALDTATGFAELQRLVADPSDTLTAHAGAMRAQLLEVHPQLAELPSRAEVREPEPCPA
ncbi:hypothetical protein HME9302_01649 [Alteripontixanthobacter maritimus]|uniref:Uncharacterized protein n=1 Tax=Alteripontixanthobacter maritimus TaxID=2161824 RepID=A0A369Q7K1_9SPHN|nr:hypothetical protein [Alteripontixanthobacter maritimus]RDC60442.1 hypothetical protein HME9302_01649 [Alteripontixanthobacter maritimus]